MTKELTSTKRLREVLSIWQTVSIEGVIFIAWLNFVCYFTTWSFEPPTYILQYILFKLILQCILLARNCKNTIYI